MGLSHEIDFGELQYLRFKMACTLPQPLSAIAFATARAAVLDIELQTIALISSSSGCDQICNAGFLQHAGVNHM